MTSTTTEIDVQRVHVVSSNSFDQVLAALDAEIGHPDMSRFGQQIAAAKTFADVEAAGSYAPVTILVDERADGVHLSYDRMASYLAPYGSADALRVARDLDSKVERLLTAAAG